jgi:hypothetical protein
MSKFVYQPGRGSIIGNKFKMGGSKQPDKIGELKLDRDYKAGEVIRLACWDQMTRIGPVISIRINNKPDKEIKPDPEAGDVPF